MHIPQTIHFYRIVPGMYPIQLLHFLVKILVPDDERLFPDCAAGLRTPVFATVSLTSITLTTTTSSSSTMSTILLTGIAFVSYFFSYAFALPPPPSDPRPLVIWHGMGDTYCAPGILEFIDTIKQMHPGIFVHSIYINESEDEDRRAGWVSLLCCTMLTTVRLTETGTSECMAMQFGNLHEQVANVSLQLSSVPELQDGFDAMGFSQGASPPVPQSMKRD